MKIKNIHSASAHVKRIRRHVIDWEKIFAKHIPNKALIFTKCEEPSKLNVKKDLYHFYNCM